MALQITVVQARDLPVADATGKTDPYVELYVNGVSHKTKTIKKTLTPYWGETFTFYPSSFNPSTDSIRVDVYDWDRFSNNDLLTRNLLPIAKYASAGTVEEWVPLNSVKGGSSAALQIKVIFGDGRPKVAAPQQMPPQQQGFPPQQQQAYGGFPPQQQQAYGYPPQQQAYGYPPQQQPGGFPPQQQAYGGYPPQQQAYGGYPPQQHPTGGFPPQQHPAGGFPPQQQGYPSTQGGMPLQQQQQAYGGFPQGGMPPQQQRPTAGFPQGGMPPPQAGYGLPPQGFAPPQQGYPTQQPGGYPQQPPRPY
ncbi:C2 domain containing protein [Acanthamoeba castellanii str. Neff]|uniref:C2 domain containing protein n=1 Tax=Acanthamoeba castellanii (strain ATCC 30010 / Neff) TaxID=1257118 RepID=L8HHM0_ACACF|nr:C2 domain containing protein [Acanthamoeba castellanii str. Neff]ELR24697.1 C2 domain containing protein [Acanthamoeba castellanii str. Neff]